jgi:nitroreductase
MSTRPDHETLRGAIALATRAPSVHNTQPWRWLLGDSTVHLMADWNRQLPATDPEGRDLVLSCGAALHHLRVALGALGWAGEVHRVPNPADPGHLAALEPHPHTPSDEDIALAAAIPLRRTDRRTFSSWSVPPGHLDLMIRRASRAGALLVPITDAHFRHRLALAINEAATRQETDPEYATELALWSGRSEFAEDGVLSASAPRHPGYHGDTRMRTFPHGTLVESAADSIEADAGELLVLATPDDDLASWLRAGEAASAALLTATELNLAGCPLSQALEIADTRATIRKLVLDDAAEPHLILRVGWAHTAAEPLPRSPRRPLSEVIGFLPGMNPRRDER